MTTTPIRPSAPPARARVRRRWGRLVVAVLSLLLVVGGASYQQALTAPGRASWAARTAGWVRDNGGAPLVNAAENWYYTRNPPPDTAPPAAELPTPPTGAGPPARDRATLPTLPGPTTLPGEGRWTPGRATASGAPSSYTSFFQPDPHHAGVIAGVAWIRSGAATAHLVAGTQEPGGGPWPGSAQVPTSDVGALVATVNSGWKLGDTTGGFYLAGRTTGTLRDGQAALVIDDTGAVTVGQWGRDVSMTPHVVAVRQNLALVVDHGAVVPGLGTNSGDSWGSASNQLQFTWRSGIGVDATGNLVYVAGDGLTLDTLATALRGAGAVQGMELDIHPGMAFFASWRPSGSGTTPTALLPTMPSPADRYLAPDQRDFLYFTLAAPGATRPTG